MPLVLIPARLTLLAERFDSLASSLRLLAADGNTARCTDRDLRIELQTILVEFGVN